jgi:methionyl aminopeptidase
MDKLILAKYAQAGRVAAQALSYGESLIKEGAVIRDVLDNVEEFIRAHGADPAFPAQISLNSVAAHWCPTQDDDAVFKASDIVKLDVGAHVNGYVGDTALTVNLDVNNKEKELLVEASRAARDAAIWLVKAGVTPHELGAAIEREITSRGFQPIRNLSGHGLGQYQIHTSPTIPNYPNNDKRPLVAGQVVAIEPFATTGKGLIYSGSNPTVFALGADRPVRSQEARAALAIIKRSNGLPFTTRWLSQELGIAKAKLALLELKRAGVLQEYPPLPEEAGGLVSQSEHTVLIEEDGCRILTSPE